jgi:polar amino acid transport system substrate-binding protein
MKKLFALILAFAMTAALLAGCSSSSTDNKKAESNTSDTANAEATFTFKHGFDKDFPPYSYIDDNGETTGLDVELAQAVCEYYGWNYEPVPINWDAKDAELKSGSIDCIWSGFTKTPAREESYLFSDTYSINKQMIMVLEGSDIQTLEDLKGKKVGVQSTTSADEMLQTAVEDGGRADLAATFEAVQPYGTYTDAINDLIAGAIDAIAIDVTTGNYQMSKVGGLRYLDEEMGDEVYAIGFRPEDTDLCEQINEALKALAADGTVEKIASQEKYSEIYENLTLTNK